jgi:hypothetical protein
MNKSLQFRARDRHPFVYLGAAFGAILIASGVSALAMSACSPANFVVGVFAIGFGGAIVASTAYAAWGQLCVAVGDDDWCTISWVLGPWSRTKRFPRADVRSVKRCGSSSFAIVWPSMAGRQLRLDVLRETRPVDLGGGFAMDDLSLQAIEDLIGAGRCEA